MATTVPQLKALAKDLGIKGYSKLNKTDLEREINAAYAAMDRPENKYMPLAKRDMVYRNDNGGKLSARQTRRLNKKSRKHTGTSWL